LAIEKPALRHSSCHTDGVAPLQDAVSTCVGDMSTWMRSNRCCTIEFKRDARTRLCVNKRTEVFAYLLRGL